MPKLANISCLACDVVSGKVVPPGGIIFRNDVIAISHAVPPAQTKGFMIVAPLRHYEHIAQLSREEWHSLTQAIHATSKALTNIFKPEKVYVCSFGETVKHVHFYVIPRFQDMPAHGFELLHQIFKESKWQCSTEEAVEAALSIKKEFHEIFRTR